MANVNGVSRTLAAAGTRVSPSASGGEGRVIVDSYTANATANGDTITLGGCTIPAGARITHAEIRHAALGTSVTLALAVGGTTVITAAAAATAGTLTQDVGTVTTEVAATGYPIVTVGGADTTGSDRILDVELTWTSY